MSSEATQLAINVDVSKVIKNPGAVKISNAKRRKFLESYARSGNFTRAAQDAGHSRQSFIYLRNEDEKFAKAFKAIENAHLDQVEECLLSVAIQPSREGFNDRKLLLQSKRGEIYGNKVQVQSNHTLSVNIEMPELNRILQQHNIAAATKREEIPDAEVIEILPNSHNKALAKR